MSGPSVNSAYAPVVVAGGGPVGATLALALAGTGVPVALVDPRRDAGVADARPIALSASSTRILATLGVWPRIAARACPIRMVHVSEQGRFGIVRLRAEEHGVDALGHVAPAAAISAALEDALAAESRVRRVSGTRVVDAWTVGDGVRLTCHPADAAIESARLLVAAEGGTSSLLQSLGVACRETDYRQQAVVCTMIPGRPHGEVAYERFTGDGPLALLPLASGECALVWTLPDERARAVVALDEHDFLAAVQREFGQRLGVFEAAGERSAFPLAMVRSASITAPRVALVGNAANRLHPVAGQGLNLGLRDAATLAELVAPVVKAGGDPGASALLARYARLRRADQRAVAGFTDALARAFTVTPGPAGTLRSLAMLTLDLVPPMGRALARRAMGLAGRQPRLVRGVMP